MPSRGPARFRALGTILKVKHKAQPDESGRVDLTNDANWECHCQRRMEVIAIGAREIIHSQTVVADITHRVTMRKDPETAGITPKMRVKIGSKTFEITKAIEIGNPALYIELSTIEVV